MAKEEKRQDKKEMKQPKADKPRKAEPTKDYTNIVRLLNTDLNGNRPIVNSLRAIKGISFPMANIIIKKSKIPPSTKTSSLTEEQLALIEGLVKNPAGAGIPHHFLNVRNEPETGASKHLTGSELDIHTRNWIAELKKVGTYVGIRHRGGHRVRGQRTRSTGRGKTSVGVAKPGKPAAPAKK